MVDAVVVDNGDVIVAGGAYLFQNTITKAGVPYNLTGKTVTATIRRDDGTGVIGATLEDIAVTVATPLAGVVELTLTTGLSVLLSGANALMATDTVAYLLQYKVVEDAFYPQVLRFYVRKKLD